MNDEIRIYGRIITYIGLLFSPPVAVLAIYAYLHDLKIGRNPSLKALIMVEIFLISYSIFAYWAIKRFGWDFWRKDK